MLVPFSISIIISLFIDTLKKNKNDKNDKNDKKMKIINNFFLIR